MLGQQQRILTVDIAGRVDGSALVRRNLGIAVGPEQPPGGKQAPRPPPGGGEKAIVVSALASITRTQLKIVGGRPDGDDVDYAANRT